MKKCYFKFSRFVCLFLSMIMLFSVAPVDLVDWVFGKVSALSAPENVSRRKVVTNYVTDGDFEEYTSGDALKNLNNDNRWYGKSYDNGTYGTWPYVAVSDAKAKDGTKSLKVYAPWNAVYRKVTQLSTNTDYIISFDYWCTFENLEYVAVIADDGSDFTHQGAGSGTIVTKNYTVASKCGTDGWKNITFSFNSGNNDSVIFLLNYNPSQAADEFYIDNLGIYQKSDCEFSLSAENGSFKAAYNTASFALELTALPDRFYRFSSWTSGSRIISTDSVFKVHPKDVYAYTPSFYCYNMINDGGFESYPGGTNLKEIGGDEQWLCVTDDGGDWGSASVTSDIAHSGKNSLALRCMYNTMYRKISGLRTNSQYRVSFYYRFSEIAGYDPGYLSTVSVVDASDPVTYMASQDYLNLATGGTDLETDNGWVKREIVFLTGDSTDVNLCIRYCGTAENGGISMYLDDLIVEYAPLAAPTYATENFEDQKSVMNWTNDYRRHYVQPVAAIDSDFGSQHGQIQAPNGYYSVASKPIQVKKGCTYTFDIWVNLLDYTDFLNFGIVTDSGKFYGSFYSSTLSSGTFLTVSDKSGNILKRKSGCYDSQSQTYSSYQYVYAGESYLQSAASGKAFFKVSLSMTAQTTDIVYFAISLNGANGMIDVDHFSVTESGTPNYEDMLQSFAYWYSGSAIRITGMQGLRERTSVDRSALTSDGYAGHKIVEYGTVAIKSLYLGGDELVVGGTYSYGGKERKAVAGVAYSLEERKNVVYALSPTAVDFTGVLCNISESNYTNDYAIRTFFKYQTPSGEIKTCYADPSDRSIYEIAKYICNAKYGDEYYESEKNLEYLHQNIVDKYTDRTVTVNNASTPLTQNFGGVSATVYHCWTLMEDYFFNTKNNNKNYTEAQAALEMDRLRDSGITTVRSIYLSDFAWDYVNGGYNWDSDRMQAIYKWAEMLQERNINIALNAGWHLEWYVDPTNYGKPGHDGGISERDYLRACDSSGNLILDDKYAEASGVDRTNMDENKRIQIASLRYGEWMAQTIQAFKARGLNNLEYLIAFTEPSYSTSGKPEGNYADGWLAMVEGLNTRLKAHGLRQSCKIVGPNQYIYSGNGLLKYYLEYCKTNPEAEGWVDILSSHLYSNADKDYSIKDSNFYYDTANSGFQSYKSVMDSYGTSKDFWVDEYFASSEIDGMHCKYFGKESPVQMTQVAAGVVAAMNNGLERVLTWQIFDQAWVNNGTNNAQFVDGIHACGTAPSLAVTDKYKFGSTVPRKNYYGLNLLGKHLGSTGGKVYDCDFGDAGGLYVGYVVRSDGKVVLLAVNTTEKPTNVQYTFASKIRANMCRYVYDPTAVIPTEEAKTIACDKEFNGVVDGLHDTIPPYSFVVYVGERDTDMDLDMTE